MKRSHMNFCKECREAFTIKNNLDYCERCRILLGVLPGDNFDSYSDEEMSWMLKEMGRQIISSWEYTG